MIERLAPKTIQWDLHYMEHAQRYEFFAPRCAGRRVLDAACGIGFGTRIIAEHGAALVVGLDNAPDAITYADAHYQHPSSKFVVGDCEALEQLGMTFDVVMSFETIEHIHNPERFVDAVHAVLGPGGLFICSTPNILRHSLAPGRARLDNPFHVSEMHFADFKACFSRRFAVKEAYYQTEHPAYLRYMEMQRELRRFHQAVTISRLLRFENRVRAFLGRATLAFDLDPPAWERPLPGDYLLEPLQEPDDWHKTFILVGERQ